MEVQVLNVSDKTYPNIGRYYMAEMTCGKHAAIVVVTDNYVRVLVQDASHKCWRGMGKQFAHAYQALEAYKTAAVRSMIQTALDGANA